MKAVIQRVLESSVTVKGKTEAHIQRGILTFLGVEKEDTLADLEKTINKIISLRIFPDAQGKMNLSLQDIDGEHLIVPQFTLLGNCRKGHRPSFDRAAPPALAKDFFQRALKQSQTQGIKTQGGIFQADMRVSIENEGPVTLILEV